MARITLENVVKEFPGRRGRVVRAVDQLTLDIRDGELLAVLGPSGCGKTTLLRLIAGLDPVTSGTVCLDGRPATQWDAAERDVAMVFQRDALLPHLTARGNIELGLRLRGHARAAIEERVREASALLHLEGALDRLPRALSGGERQRVALARAWVRRPRAFLLDEPLASLDAPLRGEMRGLILELHRRLGATILHVTHDQAEAMALGQRVAVLNNGLLQQVADPPELYHHPANAFVAGFVGSPPMNLFRGSVSHQGGALWFHDSAETGLSLCLTETQGAALAGFARKEIVLGLRAGDIVDPREGRAVPYGSEVEAVAVAVEFLGVDVRVQWSCGPSRFETRMRHGEAPSPGTRMRLIFDLQRAWFFDGTTGRALQRP